MKFVALALALLLAVGSQAASLQADAPELPSQLDHAWSAMDVSMTQVKTSVNKILEQLDDAEYSDIKVAVSKRLDEMQEQMKEWQKSAKPVTENVVKTLLESTAELRATLTTDYDNMKADLLRQLTNLRTVLNQHITQYKELLEPVINDYSVTHAEEMEALKAKLKPVMVDIQKKLDTNTEETKAALMPIVEVLSTKMSEYLESLKAIATPYVEEYKTELKTAYASDTETLKQKITSLGEEIKVKLQAMLATTEA